ncbi:MULTISPECIES: maleylpyruvate isomerase family mycothiol-dependent enzyme [unclassified Arthrobacter]|uniref:maleylpyruvate isomerase family mycothiol-dependent enzyme n=1 Tax=unclassified Arthrobacter TaxID=235627 RepID=UPI001D15DEB0|nr:MULTISPECIES: maleylpyruvate isomerase family mycothiol-dependent enzyme [unclassified Arthrobacter]MCC3291013.1 maleylpyruvate isomerase family mycothiol-dependent enzyme [Arthrobacter sp. zg-Y1110]MCC3301587.1 maleylpyruvate isomerase family mycothiol-dependent enzyme [Arthrobacter sp. zg-Y895]UWX86422.1 maleylpyruvate isomerase family mycothiol-dependent enzyme [Arthrobacter sp. zg-Y1110]
MRKSTAAVWETVHAERQRLAADLSPLQSEQWEVPSLCPGWSVHDVLAHLVDTALTGRIGFVRGMLGARLDFDRVNQRGVLRQKRQDPQDTVRALRDVAELTRTPPVNPATRLVEAIVHGEDIRRPLGLVGSYPEPAVIQALAYQVRTPVAFGGGRERAAGLLLVDRRTGTAWGAGTRIEADALDLLLTVSGRPVELDPPA